ENLILRRIDDILQENTGSAVLFLCYQEVKKIVHNTEITELHAEENRIARKNSLLRTATLHGVSVKCLCWSFSERPMRREDRWDIGMEELNN
ncbi:hypothetical protein NECAME_19386, partial [Necator americanus]